MPEKKLQKVGTSLTEDLHAKLKSLAAARKLKMQEVVAQGILLWMRSQGQHAGDIYPYPEKHREWHERLEKILRGPEREGIEWNLIWGADHLQRRAPRTIHRDSTGPPSRRRAG